MKDTVGVMHAAYKDFVKEEQDKHKKKVQAKPKEYNEMWQNLAYIEERNKKIEADEKKFIPPEKP
jgi:hypothetical protein